MLSLFQHVIVSFSFVTEYFFKSKALKRSELIFVLLFKGPWCGTERNWSHQAVSNVCRTGTNAFLTLGLLAHVVSANSGALPLGNHAKSVVQLEKCFQFPHLLVRFYVTAFWFTWRYAVQHRFSPIHQPIIFFNHILTGNILFCRKTKLFFIWFGVGLSTCFKRLGFLRGEHASELQRSSGLL